MGNSTSSEVRGQLDIKEFAKNITDLKMTAIKSKVKQKSHKKLLKDLKVRILTSKYCFWYFSDPIEAKFST